MFGRPMYVPSSRGSCSPSKQQQQAESAFRDLADDLNSSRPRRYEVNEEAIKQQKEAIRQQQEWINRAVGIATDVAAGLASGETNEAMREQQEWLKRAFGVANDVASGLSSPRYEINDGEDAFQVALDVPGVKASDIDVSVEEDILTVKGQREIGGEVRKFSKSFSIDPSVDTDKITAQLNNGVLVLTAPKDIKKVEENIKKIPVMQVADEDIPVVKSESANTKAIDAPDAPDKDEQDSSESKDAEADDSNSKA